MIGRHDADGFVTLFAITSMISANGDQGTDPNKLVKVTDRVDATTLPTDEWVLGKIETIRAAKAGEVLRGVALAPIDGRDDDHDGVPHRN